MVRLVQNRNLIEMDVESITTLQEILIDFGYAKEALTLSCRPEVMDLKITQRFINIGLINEKRINDKTVIYSTPKFWFLNKELRKKLTDEYPDLADYVRAIEHIYALQKTV